MTSEKEPERREATAALTAPEDPRAWLQYYTPQQFVAGRTLQSARGRGVGTGKSTVFRDLVDGAIGRSTDTGEKNDR